MQCGWRKFTGDHKARPGACDTVVALEEIHHGYPTRSPQSARQDAPGAPFYATPEGSGWRACLPAPPAPDYQTTRAAARRLGPQHRAGRATDARRLRMARLWR